MKNTVIISALTLIIGFGLGHLTGGNPMSHSEPTEMDIHAGHHTTDESHMSAMMAEMNRALAGKTGDEFDEVFIREMIVHHEGAVEMAKAALTAEARPEIVDLANEIIAAQEAEIALMKEWQASWFPVAQ